MAPDQGKAVSVPEPDRPDFWSFWAAAPSEAMKLQDNAAGDKVGEGPPSEPDDPSHWSGATPPESAASQLPEDDDDRLPKVEEEEEDDDDDDDDDDEVVLEDDVYDHPVDGAKSVSNPVPWPGSTFMICCASSGRVITLRDGRVVLAEPGSWGSMYWACEQSKGWLGFRNPVSGKLLGHDGKGRLRCSADRHRDWEKFCVRQRPGGGYVLLMTHYDELWRVGTGAEGGLAKIEESSSDEIVWGFIKVDAD